MNQFKKRFSLLVGIGLIGLLAIIAVSYCGKKKSETAYEMTPDESGVVAAKPDLKQLQQQIDSLQTLVQQNPARVELRKLLVDLAADTAAGMIRTIGHGQVPTDARNPVMGRQAAERAAKIDAARWASYVMAWLNDIDAIDYGSISATVAGGRILESRETDTGDFILLVETPMPDSPE